MRRKCEDNKNRIFNPKNEFFQKLHFLERQDKFLVFRDFKFYYKTHFSK